MKNFTSFHPTQFIMGDGTISQAGSVTAQFGTKALLITAPEIPPFAKLYADVKQNLTEAGIEIAHFDQVIPNPDTECVAAASAVAKELGADVIVALGGGSSIDTAKCVALEAAYDEPCWSFRFGGEREPGPETLPVIAIPTTSGTGSEATLVAVVSNHAENYKSIILHPEIYAKATIVDPELTASMPAHLTASVGFDAFAHCFESFISAEANPMSRMYAFEGLKRSVRSLETAVLNPTPEARADMSIAATLGGMAISENGVTLPHGMGMAIGGFCHTISHGESMAVVYPEILRQSAVQGGENYAAVAKLFDPKLGTDANLALPGLVEEWLNRIGLLSKLSDFGITEEQLEGIAAASVEQPGWQVHPRVHNEQEMLEILQVCHN